MKLTELIRLNEGKQVGEVYHFTSMSGLNRILESDFLKGRDDIRIRE